MKGKFEQLINQDTPVLVDFYADWCGPCQMMAPVLKEVAQEMGDKVKVIKIDVDKNQPIAQRFGVRSIPTLILFKNGKILENRAGVLTKRDLTKMIEQAS
ncbi:thioredoxin [Roseivirga sp.]|uniref:thioredoxin n=1 Tax=Roseivirga sp. TaxID=1964215 RepID=UPI003B8DEC13